MIESLTAEDAEESKTVNDAKRTGEPCFVIPAQAGVTVFILNWRNFASFAVNWFCSCFLSSAYSAVKRFQEISTAEDAEERGGESHRPFTIRLIPSVMWATLKLSR
ncbi:MAG: hypothetical protein ACREUA_07805, partial [Burkholderiales bacterium]